MLGHEGPQRSRKACCVNRRKVEERREGPKINTRNAVASQASQSRIRDRYSGWSMYREIVYREKCTRRQTSGESQLVRNLNQNWRNQ
jgi:hypothetical protein